MNVGVKVRKELEGMVLDQRVFKANRHTPVGIDNRRQAKCSLVSARRFCTGIERSVDVESLSKEMASTSSQSLCTSHQWGVSCCTRI